MFGEVAEQYDRRRPSYPAVLIDDLAAYARAGNGGEAGRALEVGAGTGKATTLLAARGVPILALEPSAPMAAVARRNCERFPHVEIVESDFERWDPAGTAFPLIYSAQAWHWVDPATRYVRARAALAPGGVLAVFWNVPAWGRSPIREALSAAYRATVPELRPDGPMHPDNHTVATDEDWLAEIGPAEGLTDATVVGYDWSVDYDPEQYTGLLATLSEVRLMDPDTRDALLSAVAEAIERHGGTLHMPMSTRLCLARAR